MIKNKLFSLILFIIIIYISKPSFIFKPNGFSKEYGVGFDSDGYRKTFFTFNTIILTIAILISFDTKFFI